MTTPVRVFVAMSLSAVVIAVSPLAGCSDQVSADSLGRVQAWMPGGAVRAFPLIGPSDLPRAAGVRFTAGQREGLVPIGEPEASGRHWWTWPARGARVSQSVLVKTAEGHFYRGEYVWRDDVIIEGCVELPGLCARFEDFQAIDVDEARAMLSGARQSTPALVRQFFGVSSVAGVPV